jgi:hypothetical protein
MANDVTSFGSAGALVSRSDLAKSLNRASAAIAVANSDLQYLKMDKGNGNWFYGQEETRVDADSLWAVNPLSIQHGYVAWDSDAGGPPLQEIMLPSSQDLPPMSALPSVPSHAPYKRQNSVQLVCIADPSGSVGDNDVGTTCEYKQSSYGAMKFFKALIDQIADRIDAGDDRFVPVVKLTNNSYKHDKYGRIYNPDFAVVEWRTITDNSAPVAEGEATAEDEEAELAAAYEEVAAASADAPRRRNRDR